MRSSTLTKVGSLGSLVDKLVAQRRSESHDDIRAGARGMAIGPEIGRSLADQGSREQILDPVYESGLSEPRRSTSSPSC
jgi:hypothetical protein